MEIKPYMLSLQFEDQHNFIDGADTEEAAKDMAALYWNDYNKKWNHKVFPGKIHIWKLKFTETGPKWEGTEFPGG